MTSDPHADIDWNRTTWEGSRREQLRRAAAMTLRERLEALEELARTAELLRAMRERRQGTMPNPHMTPDQIRAARQTLGLTQSAFARALGLPSPEQSGQVTVSDWERGVHPPGRFVVRAIQALLAERPQ